MKSTIMLFTIDNCTRPNPFYFKPSFREGFEEKGRGFL